jgi:ATP-dependent exoDNAse (exonuclease V) beta subunit
MTRAQEHLVLVGTTGIESPARWAARWSGHRGPLPADAVLGARTMLDWLGPVAAATKAADVFEVRVHDPADVQAWRHPSQRGGAAGERLRRLANLEPLDPPPGPHPVADEAIRRLTTRYAFEPFARTAAARPMAEGATGRTAATLAKSPLLTGTAPPTGDEIGSATHRVLQHLDFRRTADPASIAAQVNELVDRRILSAAEAARVDVDAIAWLMVSDVGSLLRDNAANLRRELPIYAAAPPPVDGASTDPADQVMLRGRIDVLLPLADRTVLIDYKTDDVAAENVRARADGYWAQVDAYAHAIQRMTGKPVDVMLVFLRPRVVYTVARATRP